MTTQQSKPIITAGRKRPRSEEKSDGFNEDGGDEDFDDESNADDIASSDSQSTVAAAKRVVVRVPVETAAPQKIKIKLVTKDRQPLTAVLSTGSRKAALIVTGPDGVGGVLSRKLVLSPADQVACNATRS
jgi:hypothetical protein